jgi:hypothetical protein
VSSQNIDNGAKRLEAALDPTLAAYCPGCGALVCAPGDWCDDCEACRLPDATHRLKNAAMASAAAAAGQLCAAAISTGSRRRI